MDGEAWEAAVHGVAKSRMQLSDFTFTFHFHALEKEMATYASVLAWRIPGTGEPGGLPSLGSHRVRHDWSDLAAAAAVSEGSGNMGLKTPHFHWNIITKRLPSLPNLNKPVINNLPEKKLLCLPLPIGLPWPKRPQCLVCILYKTCTYRPDIIKGIRSYWGKETFLNMWLLRRQDIVRILNEILWKHIHKNTF